MKRGTIIIVRAVSPRTLSIRLFRFVPLTTPPINYVPSVNALVTPYEGWSALMTPLPLSMHLSIYRPSLHHALMFFFLLFDPAITYMDVKDMHLRINTTLASRMALSLVLIYFWWAYGLRLWNCRGEPSSPKRPPRVAWGIAAKSHWVRLAATQTSVTVPATPNKTSTVHVYIHSTSSRSPAPLEVVEAHLYLG